MKKFAILLALTLPLAAQTQVSRSFVGTVTGFRPESAEVEIRPDTGDTVAARLTADTLAQKIAPGEKDLKKAEAIQVTNGKRRHQVLGIVHAAQFGLAHREDGLSAEVDDVVA